MGTHRSKLCLLLLNFPQIACTFSFAIYSIWYDDYAWRTVGPGVVYAGYMLLVVAASQVMNAIAYLAARKDAIASKFTLQVTIFSISMDLVFLWFAIHFQYQGSGTLP
jgi:hypothetical protein